MLEEVRFVHNLKRNLISLGELKKKGYVFKGERGVLKVLRGSMVLMKGVKKNDLYALEDIASSNSTFTIQHIILSKSEIRHKRLGHVSKKCLLELKKQCLFGSDKIELLRFCEHCV